MTEATSTYDDQPTVFGHPKGLFYLFFAELWERFSFYGMRALLTLYMVNVIFEALLARDFAAAAVYSSYGSLVYASTVIGGRLSDSILGMRSSIFLGGILMAVGHFVLAIENNLAFFLALAFIVVGNGFFKPNISTFVGTLYEDGDPKKDSGFTIFYMGINIGGFVAPLLCGWLGATYGWHYGFGLAGIGMLTGLLVFWHGIRTNVFGERGHAPVREESKSKKVSPKLIVYVLSVLAVPVIAWLLSSYKPLGADGTFFGDQNIVNIIFKLIGVAVLVYLGYIMYQATLDERKKLFVAVFITLFMTVFWGFHELSGSVITLFAARNVNLILIDAAQTNALNSMYIIILSIPISLMWTYLSKKKINPRTPYKFAMGLAFAGISFYILALSGGSADGEGMVPFSYLMIMYFLISVGELFMSPVGLSKITDLSPKRIVAFMMGVWFLSSAFAFQIVGFIGKKLAIESTDKNVGGLETIGVYTDGFELIAYYALGAAVIVLILSPILSKLMGKVH
ncbi:MULTISPECIES: peptide MFS transporter [unclassified Leeuwenhoekiella]|uniref:peptide MFS transporter n=1 Tax=unclassified Leeuwenhoekiella TaxID=2615029 RepID=UPI000C4686E1|nr:MULTISPECIES: oligopeptide:H+ symporter [unclassified Leeuwenhoekiella]MAW97174.1 MFS transporter [Leeuwenhoekiella sp.]MBA82740.1 MFS transporter [Leeuwenhoekiella sp.]|tara:strand:- start:52281 stop:53810 length:1530 start_codon:yes stop_codon:yes gene_type:complete